MSMALPGAADPVLGAAALLVLKSTLLLGAAALGALLLRRAPAAGRHLLWMLALGALLALPVLSLAGPRWRPGFLAFRAPAPAAPATYVFDQPVRFASNGPVVAPAPAPAAARTEGRGFPLAPLLLAVWAAGALAVLGRLALGIVRVRRLAREAEPVADYAWTWLAARLGPAVGVRRPVRLLRSPAAAMPMTWGTARPAVLLPADADGWTPERRRVVLLHELAHVARGDCLTQVLAEVCCALWWFHPGAWWAARRMRLEREQACDDRVLAAGARASEYAAHLLDVARAYAPTPAVALAMARPSHLEGRVRAVLEPERDRRGVTARTGAICAGAVLLAALPLAAVAPSTRPAEAERAPKRVSLTVPVRGQVDASGRVTGRGTADARIDGVDMHFDVNVQMTLDPPARPEVDDAGRLPPFADPRPEPDPLPAFASAGEDGGAASPGREVLQVDGFRMVLRPDAVLEISDESAGAPPLRLDLRRYLEPRLREALVDEVARAAAAWQVRPASVAAAEADGDCPETRKARQARALVGKMATARRGEAGRIVAQLVHEFGGGLVDDLADAVSDIEADLEDGA